MSCSLCLQVKEHDEVDTVANEIMSHLFNEEVRQSMLAIDESIFVDEQMMHYNFRPITYTLCSILIISLPITLDNLHCCTDIIYINIVHIFYLSLNLLMMLLLIPLYAMCVACASNQRVFGVSLRKNNAQKHQ